MAFSIERFMLSMSVLISTTRSSWRPSRRPSRRPSPFLSCNNNSKCINSPRIFSSHLIFKISVLVSSVNASVTMCSWTYVKKRLTWRVMLPCVPVALRNKTVVSSGKAKDAFDGLFGAQYNKIKCCK